MEYFRHALSLKPEEEALRIKMEEWLPERIIDTHAHCNLESHVKSVNPHAYGHMLSTFTHLSLEDSIKLREIFYPNKIVQTLRFPKTFRGIDHVSANEYLLENSPDTDRVAVFGLPENIDYTVRMMHSPRASALKMYWSYVDPPAEKIYDFFTPEILEEAQKMELPIILHLPKMIIHMIDDLTKVLSDFPRLKVVLAHIGLSKLMVPGLEEAFSKTAAFDNVWVDTALNPSAEVISSALNRFGCERVMYGSDEPLNLIRSVAYEHPTKGERIVTDYQYHWVDVEDHTIYGRLAKNAVHAQWRCVEALRTAINQYSVAEQESVKRQVFHDNAKLFFGF